MTKAPLPDPLTANLADMALYGFGAIPTIGTATRNMGEGESCIVVAAGAEATGGPGSTGPMTDYAGPRSAATSWEAASDRPLKRRLRPRRG